MAGSTHGAGQGYYPSYDTRAGDAKMPRYKHEPMHEKKTHTKNTTRVRSVKLKRGSNGRVQRIPQVRRTRGRAGRACHDVMFRIDHS